MTVVADDMLGTVFRNLLTNAVRHNDTDRAEIDVSVEVRDDDALVQRCGKIGEDRVACHALAGRGGPGVSRNRAENLQTLLIP